VAVMAYIKARNLSELTDLETFIPSFAGHVATEAAR
jgi:hypothetical protein